MSAGRNINSLSQSWGTPIKYAVAIRRFFDGTIHLDPCSNKYSIIEAEVEYALPHSDGLKMSWDYPSIFVNPPYGRDKEMGTSIRDWLAKCAATNENHGSEVIALVPVAVNTSHWKRYVFTKAVSICFLYDTRLRFLENGVDTGKGAPMACSLVYWGNRQARFYEHFIGYGAVVDIRSLIGETIGAEHNGKPKPKKQKKELTLSLDFNAVAAG